MTLAITAQQALPALSVVIATADGFETIRQLLRYLVRQTICKQIEIVFVTPRQSSLVIEPEAVQLFWGYQIIETGPFRSVNHARSTGIQHARATVVVLTEDHCFPMPNWAQALLEAHQGPWVGVGPVVGLANQQSLQVWASFFIQYAAWMKPSQGGRVADIPGHNSSYKKDILLQYGDRLEMMMDFEYVMHQDLQRRGYQLYTERRAEVYHLFMTEFRASQRENFTIGRLLAATRAHYLPAWKRLAYVMTTPLLPALRTWRILKEIWNFGWQKELLPGLLPWLLLGLSISASGELTGYLIGKGAAQRTTLDLDFHRDRFISEAERLRLFSAELIDFACQPVRPTLP
jgi:Glycosyl transferase family 2